MKKGISLRWTDVSVGNLFCHIGKYIPGEGRAGLSSHAVTFNLDHQALAWRNCRTMVS